MKSQMAKVKSQNYRSKLKNKIGLVSEGGNFNYPPKTGPRVDLMERANEFSVDIVRFVSEKNKERIFNPIFDQLLRSATSIGANLVEAKASSSRREFLKFYEISLKSANETKYWLRLIKDALTVEEQRVSGLMNEAVELSNIIASVSYHSRRNGSFEL